MRRTNRIVEAIAEEYQGLHYSDVTVDEEIISEPGYRKLTKSTDPKTSKAGNGTSSGKKQGSGKRIESVSDIGSGECPQIEKEFEVEKRGDEKEKEIC